MNYDEFIAHQDEQEQINELAKAIEDATNAGLDVDKIRAEARKGYKNIPGFKMKVNGTDTSYQWQVVPSQDWTVFRTPFDD